jgi:hypothetical protein
MKIKIEEIHSKDMFPGLIMGKPKDGHYEESLKEMEKILSDDIRPIHNISKTEWKQITKSTGEKYGYGSFGHITGVKISIVEGDDNYDFSLIFNFYPGLETFDEALKNSIQLVDWKNNSFKWDIGDL